METLKRVDDTEVLDPIFFNYQVFAHSVKDQFDDYVRKPPYCHSPQNYPSPKGVLIYGCDQRVLNQSLEAVRNSFNEDSLTFLAFPEVPKGILEHNSKFPNEPFHLLDLGEFIKWYGAVNYYFNDALHIGLEKGLTLNSFDAQIRKRVVGTNPFFEEIIRPAHWVLFNHLQDSPFTLDTVKKENGFVLVPKVVYTEGDIVKLASFLSENFFRNYSVLFSKRFNTYDQST